MQVFFKQVLVVVSLALFSVGAQANPALAKKKGCASCHGGVAGVNVKTPLAGMPQAPSFYDLYAKYGGQQDAEGKMLAALQESKRHPKVALNDTERKALAQFYMSTDPVETSGQRQMAAKESAQIK